MDETPELLGLQVEGSGEFELWMELWDVCAVQRFIFLPVGLGNSVSRSSDLQGLAEGAALATCRFIDQRAPVPCRSPNLTPTPFRPVIFAEGFSSYARELQAAHS